MVIDPALTERIVKASQSPTFDRITEQLNALYSPAAYQSIAPSMSDNRVSNHSVVYNLGGISITQQQADSMTVTQFMNFVKSSGNLSIHNNHD